MAIKHQTYIDLLKANHNIIFNGAPGTGKTYLAKEIAEAMGAKYKMVQFHPSYDYTDFVEGLRPVKDDNGNIGFERKDGVFKEFCKKSFQKTTSKTQSSVIGRLDEYLQILQNCALQKYPSYYNDIILPILIKNNSNFTIRNKELVYVKYSNKIKSNHLVVKKSTYVLHIRKEILMRFILNCSLGSDEQDYKDIVEILNAINLYLNNQPDKEKNTTPSSSSSTKSTVARSRRFSASCSSPLTQDIVGRRDWCRHNTKTSWRKETCSRTDSMYPRTFISSGQ